MDPLVEAISLRCDAISIFGQFKSVGSFSCCPRGVEAEAAEFNLTNQASPNCAVPHASWQHYQSKKKIQ